MSHRLVQNPQARNSLLRENTLKLQPTLARDILDIFQFCRGIHGHAHQLVRLGYARLPRVMEALSGHRADRRQGRVQPTVAYRNFSMAIDIYLITQREITSPTRRKLNRCPGQYRIYCVQANEN